MSTSLATGISGLQNYQRLLEVIGNNLANLNTPGFKLSRVRFSDLFNQTLRGAQAPGQSTGGTNPIQIGLGVQTANIERLFSQGSLVMTSNPLDLAVQGEGFFSLSDGAQNFYTRVGAFGLDANSDLVDTATGLKVQGVNGQDINVSLDAALPAKATQTMNISGNLDAAARGPEIEKLATVNPFTDGGAAASALTLLNDLDDNTIDYVNGDVLNVTGSDADGAAINSTFTFGAANDGTTVGDLLAVISGAYGGASASIGANGNIDLTADAAGDADLTLTLEDAAANVGSSDFSNHRLQLINDGYDGDTYTATSDVFDSQGRRHAVTLTFQKAADNEFNVTASIPSSSGTLVDGSVQGLRFNDDGSFDQVTGAGGGDSDIEIQFDGIANPQTIALNFGTSGKFDGITQFGGDSAVAARQDGYEAGAMNSLSVGTDGTLQGIFTNGQSQDIAQLQLVSFNNRAGLEAVGNSMFRASANSGDPTTGTGREGTVVGGSLEESNVDLAAELTKLIVAQRGFQANARTVTITDRLLAEATNLAG